MPHQLKTMYSFTNPPFPFLLVCLYWGNPTSLIHSSLPSSSPSPSNSNGQFFLFRKETKNKTSPGYFPQLQAFYFPFPKFFYNKIICKTPVYTMGRARTQGCFLALVLFTRGLILLIQFTDWEERMFFSKISTTTNHPILYDRNSHRHILSVGFDSSKNILFTDLTCWLYSLMFSVCVSVGGCVCGCGC